MKIAIIIALIMMLSIATAHNVNSLVEEHRKPDIEVTVARLMGAFNKGDFASIVGGNAYDIARSGVGCGAGFFGGLDTGFTIYGIIAQDPTNIQSYVFAVIYSISWWQQNGQYLEVMCTNFWTLLH